MERYLESHFDKFHESSTRHQQAWIEIEYNSFKW